MSKRFYFWKQNGINSWVSIAEFVRHFILSWLFAVATEYILLPNEVRNLGELNGLTQMCIIRVLGLTCGMAMLLTVTSCLVKTEKIERIAIAVTFAVLATASLRTSATWPFFGICFLIFSVLTVYAIHGWNKKNQLEKKQVDSRKAYVLITVGLSVCFFLFVSAWTLGRVYSFCCPTYDFAIFSQMFHNMKETGLPITTVERDTVMSHFDVHISPIYYLMLPVYYIFPKPATLQVLQAAVLTSAVIPLWKLGKHHGLTNLQRMFLCMILFLYPSYSGGTSYDIHENCFLTPLIFWLLYGIDSGKKPVIAVSAILMLMVKEDAAVYVATIALWIIAGSLLRYTKKDMSKLFSGIILFVISVGWFIFAISYLTTKGDGVMTCRYGNFIIDDSSPIINVIMTMIMHPMKIVYECVDYDKLKYIAMTLGTLLGLPLFTRRYERYILFIPYILVNLIPDYQYQHDIFFQYTFGSGALLIYLTAVNLADIKRNWQKNLALILALGMSIFAFAKVVVPKAVDYPIKAVRDYEYYQTMRDVLDKIPGDAKVAATSFYTAYLSGRDTLYDVYYCSEEHLLEAEYIVIDKTAKNNYKKYATGAKGDGYEAFVALLVKNGYTQYESIDSRLLIWQKPDLAIKPGLK